jgi:hypothetical protein
VATTAEDLEMIEAVVDSLDSALEQIDATVTVPGAAPSMAPVSQLACIGVAVVRGVLPIVRQERDRMRAEVAGGKA